ncbi:MAG: AbrB/MazE/SpoVT family DNA-binding domain-containing protein [Nanoarchaeota archaeon]|nr:AbrB/MazE/SpoVT family DNA-binding domain-containing protein [Nanoarchaeota archaeon]
MIKTIKVSDKGQIAIPQTFRENLGINKGDDLTIIQIDGKILIEKSQKTEEKIKDNFKDILTFSEESLKKVWDNEEDEVWNEYLK